MSDKHWTASRPRGLTIETGPDIQIIERDTVQCVHCGAHWQVNPYSAKNRGYCAKCNGPICGPGCLDCIPIERQLEIMEGTDTLTRSRIVVAGVIPNVNLKSSKWP